MEVIELARPHGFLLWRGKQTAVASCDPLPVDVSLLVVSDGEAFGHVTLGLPASMTIEEFDRDEWTEEHCVRPEERKLWWEGADKLCVQSVKSWNWFEAPKIYQDGEIIDYQPTEEEQVLIEQAKRLPKQVILAPAAVCLTEGNKFTATVPPGNELRKMLGAVYEVDPEFIKHGQGWKLPLYSLALIRCPRLMIVPDRGSDDVSTEQKQEGNNVPYEKYQDGERWCVRKEGADDSIQCYMMENMADRLLAALRINVEAEEEAEPEVEPEDEAEAKAFDDSDWDGAAANWETADAYCGDCLMDVNPAGEEKTKTLCYLPYRKPGSKNPNLGALRTMPTGRGMPALQRPDDVPQEDWISAIQSAANKIIGWWPDAFEKPAPASIYQMAGKKPPEGSDVAETPEEPKTLTVKVDDEKGGRRLRNEKVDLVKRIETGLADLIGSIKELLGWANYEDDDLTKMFKSTNAGMTIKQVGGEPWLITWSTNAFEDREGETFATSALENYVRENEQKKDRGYFNLFHIPSSDFARKVWQGVPGRILVEAGPFLTDAKGKAALAFFMEHPSDHPALAPEGWGCSPEYRYLPEERKTGIYKWLWITRTTVLPRAAAANIWTKSGVTEVTNMALTDQQKQAALAVFGKELGSQIVSGAEEKSKELEESGVSHKSTETPEAEVQSGEEKGEEVQQQEQQIPTVKDLAEAVASQFAVNLQPLAEAVAGLAQTVKSIEDRLAQLEAGEVKHKNKTDLPRFVLSLQQATAASTSEKTVVSEEDELKSKKPAESLVEVEGSVATHFFPGKK